MVQQSFIPKRTIHHRDFKPIGAIELLGVVDLLDTVMKVSPFVKTKVLFYSNPTKGMGNPTSIDFRTVFIRGHRFAFSPILINAYLSCPDLVEPIIPALTSGSRLSHQWRYPVFLAH